LNAANAQVIFAIGTERQKLGVEHPAFNDGA